MTKNLIRIVYPSISEETSFENNNGVEWTLYTGRLETLNQGERRHVMGKVERLVEDEGSGDQHEVCVVRTKVREHEEQERCTL